MSSSPLNTRMEKSSEPTISSSCPSSSQSINYRAFALSPVTVQNLSSPWRSKPVMEQLPPATTKGSLPISYIFPKARQLTPSDTSLSNTSLLFSTSIIIYYFKVLLVTIGEEVSSGANEQHLVGGVRVEPSTCHRYYLLVRVQVLSPIITCFIIQLRDEVVVVTLW